MRRYEEAIAAADEADRTRREAWIRDGSPYGGTVLWAACEAKAVAYAAGGQWQEAERAALQALTDFNEDEGNLRMWRIARLAQGKPVSDPELAGRKLAEFNAHAWALSFLREHPPQNSGHP